MLEWICRISSLVIFPTRGVENIKITVFSISNNLIRKMFQLFHNSGVLGLAETPS